MVTTLRQYQIRAVAQAKTQSTIVVLPTGSGKTLIASLVAKHHVSNGSNKPLLFDMRPMLLLQNIWDQHQYPPFLT